MSFKITPQAWSPDEYRNVYSFTVKYKWVSVVCTWFLLKRGYERVEVQYINITGSKAYSIVEIKQNKRKIL